MSVEKILNVARGYLGTIQGSENHKRLLSIYNQSPLPRGYKVSKNDNWCAVFVSSIAIASGCGELIPKECSCQKMIELFAKENKYVNKLNATPKNGDIIFYSSKASGYSNHVGIIERVSDNKIVAIEGNYKKSVKRRVINMADDYIVGYGTPAYQYANDSENNINKIVAHYNSNAVVVDEVRHGKWGHKEERKKLLTEAGYNATIVQALVNLLEL